MITAETWRLVLHSKKLFVSTSPSSRISEPAVTLDDGLQTTNKNAHNKPMSIKTMPWIYKSGCEKIQTGGYSRLNMQTPVQHRCLIKPFSTKDAPICVCQPAANWQKKNTQTNTANINLIILLKTDGSFFNCGNFQVSKVDFYENKQIATFFLLFYEGHIKISDIIWAGDMSYIFIASVYLL